jgi:1,4-dihydroxy-2-naphthoate octaprenyltransferase
VILLNEFPDYEADRATGKRNLTVRLGRERAAIGYAAINVASWVGFFISLAAGVPRLALWLYVPVLVLSAALAVLVARSQWRDRGTLERLCGANLVVNLGTTLAYIIAFSVGTGF